MDEIYPLRRGAKQMLKIAFAFAPCCFYNEFKEHEETFPGRERR